AGGPVVVRYLVRLAVEQVEAGGSGDQREAHGTILLRARRPPRDGGPARRGVGRRARARNHRRRRTDRRRVDEVPGRTLPTSGPRPLHGRCRGVACARSLTAWQAAATSFPVRRTRGTPPTSSPAAPA